MKRRIVGWGAVSIAIGLLFLSITYLNSPVTTTKTQTQLKYTNVTLDVVSTPAELTKGLSGSDPLPDDKGMLFVFDRTDVHGFWMKDMKYAIDIIWIDEQKRIVEIKEDVKPDTYPTVFYPKLPAKYVIELIAGNAKNLKLMQGQQLDF